MDIGKIFRNGRSQAVRLPAAYRFEGDSVRVSRLGRGVLLEPIVSDPQAWFAEMDDPSRKHLAAKSLTRFLLDTNACIALVNGKPIVERSRFQEAIANGDSIATSSIVIFELRYGVAKSTRSKRTTLA